MNIIELKEAKDLGLKKYFTGKICKHGHVSDRRVDNRRCCECLKIVDKKKYEKNKDEINKKARKARKNNPEKYRERARGYNNSDKYKKIRRVWIMNNPHKGALYNSNYRTAKLKATPHWAHKSKIEHFYRLARVLTKVKGSPQEVDHIVPLQGENICGLHAHYNLQVIPKSDNRSKGNKFGE